MKEYDPITHIYKNNGIVIPSVTSILKDVGIIDFSRVPYKKLEEGRDRGDKVHEMTRLYDLGVLDMSTVDDRLLPYLEAWKRFLRDTGFEIIDIEKRVDSEKYWFAGRLDRVGMLNEKLTIIDIKSGQMYKSNDLQLSGYVIAHQEEHHSKIKQRWGIQLKPDGYWKPEIYNNMDNGFLSCVSVYNLKRR